MNANSSAELVAFIELGEAHPGEPFFQEWNTYLQAVERLLVDGQGGKFVLIKNDAIVGLFDTDEDARVEGLTRYLLQPFLVQQVRSREPILHIRGFNMPWPASISPLAKPA